MSYSIAYGDFDKDPQYYHMPEGGDLHIAIKLALRLGKPLLLSGEPGTGKTQLAHYIAWYLNQLPPEIHDFEVPFLAKPFVFNTKTTSTAKDVFYEYDAIGHFQDKTGQKPAASFIYLKAMGLSILQTLGAKGLKDRYREIDDVHNLTELEQRPHSCVLLIDEIDKAPRDFPNDLLHEIDAGEFYINELNTRIMRSSDPQARMLTILTSNNEKSLPEAFLRRCLFYHISYFEDHDLLLDILLKRLKPFLQAMAIPYNDSILNDNYRQAITFFMKARGAAMQKKPSTSELIDWIKVLHLNDALSGKWDLDRLSQTDKEALYITLSVLLKSQKDIDSFKRQL